MWGGRSYTFLQDRYKNEGDSSFPSTPKVPGEGQEPPATWQRGQGPATDMQQPSALYCIYPIQTKAIFLKQVCIDPVASQELLVLPAPSQIETTTTSP